MRSDAQFTPGPWVVHKGDVLGANNVMLGSDADLRLIAAAPDLYEALKGALPLVAKWCHTQGDNKQFHEETLAPIRAALAKACPTPPVAATDNEGGEQ